MHRFPPFMWFASGFLFGVSFLSPYFFWCVFIALVLFIHAVKQEANYVRLFLYGVCAGTLQYFGSFIWVFTTYPIDWFPYESAVVQYAVIGVYWLITSLVMGIGGGLFAVLLKRFSSFGIDLLWVAPTLWVGSEVFKSLCYGIYTLGDGSFISASFGFGYVGYLLAEYGVLVYVAKVAGVYALSFTVVCIAAGVYLLIVRKLYTHVFVVCATASLFLLPFPLTFIVGPYQQMNQEVYVLETYFDKEFYAREDTYPFVKRTELKRASEIALREGATVLVLPENTHLRDSFATSEELFDWTEEITADRDVIIVENGPSLDARNYNVIRTTIYDTKTHSEYFMDKRYLVAQGEFLSYVYENLLRFFVTQKQLDMVKNYTRNKYGVMEDSAEVPVYVPGILFCFESIVPYSVRRETKTRHARFIAHSISHGWFTEPDSLEHQLSQMLRVHAVWGGVPIVSAGEMARSQLYLPNGTVEDGEVVAQDTYWSIKRFEF